MSQKDRDQIPDVDLAALPEGDQMTPGTRLWYGVHKSHCCFKHGCKYGDTDCPVVNRKIRQDGDCEACGMEAGQSRMTLAPADAQAIYEDFCKCHDLAQRMDMLAPEAKGSFTGTVSERLTRTFERMREEQEQSRERHARFLRKIKAMLGYENWPEIKGDFLDGVARILRRRLKGKT